MKGFESRRWEFDEFLHLRLLHCHNLNTFHFYFLVLDYSVEVVVHFYHLLLECLLQIENLSLMLFDHLGWVLRLPFVLQILG